MFLLLVIISIHPSLHALCMTREGQGGREGGREGEGGGKEGGRGRREGGGGGRASKLAPGCIVATCTTVLPHPHYLVHAHCLEVKGHRHHTNKDLTSNKLVGPHPLHASQSKFKLITLILTPSFFIWEESVINFSHG